MSEQKYCISARNRKTGVTESITGAMSKQQADDWNANIWFRKSHVYYRVSMFPFKSHKKIGR